SPPLAMVVTLRAITSLMTNWLWTEAGTKRATASVSPYTCGFASVCQSRRINFNGFTDHRYIRSLVLPTQEFFRRFRWAHDQFFRRHRPLSLTPRFSGLFG